MILPESHITSIQLYPGQDTLYIYSLSQYRLKVWKKIQWIKSLKITLSFYYGDL